MVLWTVLRPGLYHTAVCSLYHLWSLCRYMKWHSHCQAGLLCSAPDEALLTPARTKPLMINRINWCGTTLLTSLLGKEHRCPTVSAAWAPLGTESPAMPHLSPWLRPSPCLGDLCQKEGGGGGPTSLRACPLILSWHQGNCGKAVLCACYRDAAKVLLTTELVPSPDLLWGLIPTAEMGRGFGLTGSVPC